jgi:DNA repair protein RecO (recombination protein O)
MINIKTKAIILSKTKYGEADLIIRLITNEGEVYSAIAKSALKSKKRFGGGILEPTHFISAVIQKSDENSERMSVINDAQLIDSFSALRTDYDRLELAFHLLKWTSVFAREGDSHKEIFDLLGHSLKTLETHNDFKLLKAVFELKTLQLQGILPNDPTFAPLLSRSIRDQSVLNFSNDEWQTIWSKIDWIKSSYMPNA